MTSTMVKRSKSPFDTGNWSEVNGLPGQQDIVNFLRHLTSQDPNRCFTRRQLMDEIAKEFEIPTDAQESEGPKSSTTGYYTRCTYLIADAIQGVRRSEVGGAFMKRLEFNLYQNVAGNGVVTPEFRKAARAKLPDNACPSVISPVQEATYFFKHALRIGVTLQEAASMIHNKWDNETIIAAQKLAIA